MDLIVNTVHLPYSVEDLQTMNMERLSLRDEIILRGNVTHSDSSEVITSLMYSESYQSLFTDKAAIMVVYGSLHSTCSNTSMETPCRSWASSNRRVCAVQVTMTATSNSYLE